METNKFPPANITPTFPIDYGEVDAVRKNLIEKTPRFLLMQNLAMIGTHFSLLNRLSRSWSELKPEIDEAVIEHVIQQSNDAQDEVIRTLIRALRRSSWDVHASRLQEVLWTKQRVELALRDNKKLSTQRADFEILVDSIVQELCNETLQLVELQTNLSKVVGPELKRLKEKIEDTKSRMERAVAVLLETEKQVTVKSSHPVMNDTVDDKPVLDALVDALREEITVSKTVSERVSKELPG